MSRVRWTKRSSAPTPRARCRETDMTFTLTLAVELALSVLLVATLVYCSVLERRLRAVRQGQEHLKSTIGELNSSIATAGASLRALQAAAGTVGETLDRRLSVARATIDELSL